MTDAARVLQEWPEESREAAELVIDAHGQPHEVTASLLVWHNVGEWKRLVATRWFEDHHFPVPHTDSVTSVIDYRVPPEVVSQVVSFDGSVTVDRTGGEVSARCHDEQANNLALNLVHDIVTGAKTVQEAREYYGEEFLGYRRGDATPYMEALRFQIPSGTADPDERLLSDDQLEEAAAQGERRSG
ncbi:MAG TPA: hypothetical protein VK063_07710 [Beutenbergiaceae bacterium]|nr:hypothetical protein [Beutenbergiaceae bacterium]